MTTTNTQSKNGSEAEVAAAMKARALRVYKITPDSFSAQVKDMDHKDLFIIREAIDTELAKRKADAEALVKELGGKV